MSTPTINALLRPGTRLREIAPGISTALPEDSPLASFDRPGLAAFYDLVACNRLYNSWVWGYRIADLAELCRQVLVASDGPVLDAGCGSLAFSVDAHAENARKPVVFLDMSLRLLRKARARIERGLRGQGRELEFLALQADAQSPPFQAGSFGGVVCLNLLHILKDVSTLPRALRAVAAPEAPFVFTTLVEAGTRADGYLRYWAAKGELVARSIDELLLVFAREEFPMSYALRGNMAFFWSPELRGMGR